MLELRARKNCSSFWARTRSDRDDTLGTASRRHYRLDQQAVPVVRGVPRRTVYYRARQGGPVGVGALRGPDQGMIEENPSFGYRTVARLLGFNKSTV